MKGYVDVVSGKMTLRQVHNEIVRCMTYREPQQIIVDIKRTDKGYHTTLWIPEEDFKKRCPGCQKVKGICQDCMDLIAQVTIV